MNCKRCGVKFLEVDKSTDQKHMEISNELSKMGIPMSTIVYVHPKGKGCYKEVSQ